jgi:endonuclease YncB( thermonuclease family)
VTLTIVASMLIRSSDTPAQATAGSRVSAAAGQLAVLDRNTLRVGAHVVRLEGIAAPARGSVCHGTGQLEMDCGSAAANALAQLVYGRSVDCSIHGHYGQGRATGECRAAGEPRSVAPVQDGRPRAETAELRRPEATARAGGRGIWNSGS